MEMKWEVIGTSHEGRPFLIDGIDVWEHEWKKSPGDKADIVDTVVGHRYRMQVYEIAASGRVIYFTAAEFSMGVWGFYRGIVNDSDSSGQGYLPSGPSLFESRIDDPDSGRTATNFRCIDDRNRDSRLKTR